MDLSQVIDWSREALRMAMLLGGPPLLAALAVGLLVGIGQTLTQLHEPVVALVPRLIAVLVVVLALLPWLLGRWITFAVALIESIPERL
jgi:flagellar biosynthesis protein FliQ